MTLAAHGSRGTCEWQPMHLTADRGQMLSAHVQLILCALPCSQGPCVAHPHTEIQSSFNRNTMIWLSDVQHLHRGSGGASATELDASAGLWTSGSGRVHTPSDVSCFFLPQKPFMPLGSLRDQLLFPSGTSHMSFGLCQPFQGLLGQRFIAMGTLRRDLHCLHQAPQPVSCPM